MEAENANDGTSRIIEYNSCAKIKWKIANFSKLGGRLYSDIFNTGCHKWKIMIFPNVGKNKSKYLSVYLALLDDSRILADGQSIKAKLSFSVISEVHENTVKRELEFSFTPLNKVCCFQNLLPLSEFEDPNRGYLVNDICTVRVEVLFSEEEKENFEVDAEKNLSPFAEIDNLLTSIQNISESNTLEADNSSDFSAKEVAEAEKIFEQCLDMDITSVIQSGKALEFKNSLYILLTTKAFPVNKVDRTTKIIAEFVRGCSQYEIAMQDLSESQENKNSVRELKTTLKQLSAIFTPMRYQSENIDHEIARLEKQTSAKKAKKELLGKQLEEFTSQATTSKEALVCAEQKLMLSTINTKQSEQIIEDLERSWAFLKDLRTPRA